MDERENLFQYYVESVRKCLAGGPFTPLFLYQNEKQMLKELFPDIRLAQVNAYENGMTYYVIVRESKK